MKIAHILPASVTYPLHVHNARHTWALQLAQLQANQGHEVTIYCNTKSQIPPIEVRGISHSTGHKKTDNIATFTLAFEHEHDIYHSHFDSLHYEVGHLTRKPVVFTQHWWLLEQTIALAKAYDRDNIWAVPPTQYMRDYDTSLGIQTKGHIYHGIDLSFFHPTPSAKSGRLLSVGRISPEKNVETSIAVAKKAGIGMDIIGKITPKNQDYWKTLEPHIDGTQIAYLGAKSQLELIDYYTKAQAVLFPSSAQESFGLVAIEAQACGTPIIMARGGSRGELVHEQQTGFLCDTLDDYVRAAHQSAQLDPVECRTFAQQFDIHTMAANYHQLYRSLIG